MNPLNDYPEVRKVLYLVQFAVNGVLLLLGVAFAAVPDFEVPQWYVIALAVSSALWAYLGLTASQNVVPKREP